MSAPVHGLGMLLLFVSVACLVPLPLNRPELEVSGLALVTAIDDCPPISGGEGSSY